MRIIQALKTLWRWIAHIGTAQWAFGIVLPVGAGAAMIAAIFQFFTNEPLRIVIPIVVASGSILTLAATGIAIWRNHLAIHSIAQSSGRAALNLRRHPAYLEEQARQKAMLEAESERTRRNNPFARRLINPSFEDAAEKIVKDRTAEEETARALEHENRLALQKRRRAMIAECRDMAHRFTVKSRGRTFRTFLEGQRAYADIRSHLSPDYLKKLNAGRTSYSNADGARYPALVGWFLDEIDRLEKEWQL